MQISKFNIRVYGIFMNDNHEILLSDEYVLDTYMTKFPGGGLHFGEGPEDCLKRESLEEFGQECKITSHFYTTGFFQKALFYEDQQLISIYYMAEFLEIPRFKISEVPFDFKEVQNGNQSFRWTSLSELSPEMMTFPIDRHVVNLLKKIH